MTAPKCRLASAKTAVLLESNKVQGRNTHTTRMLWHLVKQSQKNGFTTRCGTVIESDTPGPNLAATAKTS
jgi:hypothetical protein